MPSKYPPHAHKRRRTSEEDFRSLYWSRRVDLVPALGSKYGTAEWCQIYQVWGQPLRKTQIHVQDTLPSETDVRSEKALEAFRNDRHGYFREGAIRRFLPIRDELKNALHNAQCHGDVSNSANYRNGKDTLGLTKLPMIDKTETLHNDLITDKRADFSLPKIILDKFDSVSEPSADSPLSLPSSAAWSFLSVPESSRDIEISRPGSAEELFKGSAAEIHRNKIMAQRNRNAEKLPGFSGGEIDRIRSRLAARDSRDASKNYPSPRHKVTEVYSPRRVKALTEYGSGWIAKDPSEISYMNLFAPNLDVSYVGWKKYQKE